MIDLRSEFSGKVVLITGGTDGIGLATARLFAAEGACVVIAARNAERGARVQAELCGLGGRVLFVAADIGRPGAAERLVARSVAEFGRLDVAVNNAAADIRIAPTADITEAEFDTSVAVNLKGLWLCMKHEIAAMQRSGVGGAIVNVASINGLSGTPTASIYSATKHAVIGLTRSAARETIAQGIRTHSHTKRGVPGCHRHAVPAPPAPWAVGRGATCARRASRTADTARQAGTAGRDRRRDSLALLGGVLVRGRSRAGHRWWVDRLKSRPDF